MPDLQQMAGDARLLRERYLADPHRPGYHFVVPEGVHAPVDPNGALFWNGRYHLCYIYYHGAKPYWGHISSVDLVHWRHHPPALAPDDRDEGIFSGGAAIDRQGRAVITYWGLGQPDGICLATSTDPQLDRWTKLPENPVLPSTKAGLAERDGVLYGTADPSAIWWEEGHYYVLTGNLLALRELERRGQAGEGGDTLYLFRSDDLVHWEYLHELYQSRREWTRADEDDMCPDFFPLPASPDGGPPSDRHMLLFISHNLGCQYYVGRYANLRFEPESHGRMTWVDNEFFAPESLLDAKGRRIMWSWVFDRRSKETKAASGWSGELSLPRLLWLGDDGTLRMRPVDELAVLRYNPQARQSLVVPADGELPLPGIAGNSLELAIELQPGNAGRCGVKVCCSADGREETAVIWDRAAGELQVDTRRSSLGEGPKVVESAPFTLQPGEPLRLRVFVDKSFVEVFANDRQAVCRRIYPTLADSVGVQLVAEGGEVTVPSLQAWEMMPSNPY